MILYVLLISSLEFIFADNSVSYAKTEAECRVNLDKFDMKTIYIVAGVVILMSLVFLGFSIAVFCYVRKVVCQLYF